MNFQTSIKTCLSKYLDFSGRASRSEYWFFFLFSQLTNIAANVIDYGVLGRRENDVTPVATLCALVLFLPSLSALIRRLHDINVTGWAALWPLVFAPLALLLMLGDAGVIIYSLLWLGALIFVIYKLAQRGTDGSNKYGPDPFVLSAKQQFNNLSANAPVSASTNQGQCINCGTRLVRSVLYCPKCGAPR